MTKTCLSVSSVAFTTARFCQRSQSEDALISRLLVSAAALALMKREMKGRREGETECLVSSPPAEEILLEQGCGNAKASS